MLACQPRFHSVSLMLNVRLHSVCLSLPFTRMYARAHTRIHYRDIFIKWDLDQDGFIDATELQKGLSSLNLGIPQGVIARVVRSIDTDGNGKLDFNEFVAAFQLQADMARTNPPSGARESAPAALSAKAMDRGSLLNTALGIHAFAGGMPPAGLVKGNASKTLKMNILRTERPHTALSRGATAHSSDSSWVLTSKVMHACMSVCASKVQESVTGREGFVSKSRSCVPAID